MIRAGRLKDRLDIQEATELPAPSGGVTRTWNTVEYQVPCDIMMKRGQESFAAQGENVVNDYEIRFRYERGLITTRRRLIDPNQSPYRIFGIVGTVDPTNSEEEIIAQCVERQWPRRE